MSVEAGGLELAWLGVVDKAARKIRPVAWQGTDEHYLKLMPLRLDDDRPGGRGLAGQAIRERKAMIVQDMTQDPRVKLRKEAEERGLHSLVMLPLLIADEAVGVLALYATEVGFFDAAEMKLLLELA